MSGSLSEKLYADEAQCVDDMLDALDWPDALSQDVFEQAKGWVEILRDKPRKFGELEVFLQQYSLDTDEGLALMCLAEALLRVPDKKTANDLIKDKVTAADWLDSVGNTSDWLVKAAGVGLNLSHKTLDSVVARLGQPIIREVMAKAMQIMGGQFVLGRDIEEAIERAEDYPDYRMSYDMLGEGARTAEDAERYFEAYKHAIQKTGESADAKSNSRRPGVSVKLSALHPRYEYAQKDRCVPAMVEKLTALASQAAKQNIALTVDAEESYRLELSLEIFKKVLEHPALENWNDFGLAVQAYQKRCMPLIDAVADMAKEMGRRIQVRLVKGAYWDTEVKHGQVESLPGYPVFTRKTNSDLSYLICAQKMLKHADVIYPMFATHNAHSIAAIVKMAERYEAEFELQRLHGMGEGLYEIILKDHPNVKASVYAPVGPYSDLLPYLVRRLLENGANSSFVHKILDKSVDVADLVDDPVNDAKDHPTKKHAKIPMPKDIFAPRLNSEGIDLDDEGTATKIQGDIQKHKPKSVSIKSLTKADVKNQKPADIVSPCQTADVLGQVSFVSNDSVDAIFGSAKAGYESWVRANVDTRASALEKYADLLEKNRERLIALCVYEAGKTIVDAQNEIREAVDFCRYYAQQARALFFKPGEIMPGPTGEDNILQHHGRGVFVCISPWNFPLAIFTGQIVAALASGNAVIAKPAEQTNLIAHETVKLMFEAGIPRDALQLVFGDGSLGGALTEHPDVAGVAFTGSTEVAKIIQRTLAAKDGPIVPLIAETGGLNAMIMDSSALPEQVVDDVITSAFGAVGQRCSALRILYVQDDVADKVIHMIEGAMAEIRIGHPENLSSDLGPIIDQDAFDMLFAHRQKMQKQSQFVCEAPLHEDKDQGFYFAPCVFEIKKLAELEREVFGPILHVIRYRAEDIQNVIDDINGSGYGLTFGVHSRIDSFQDMLAREIHVGNVYINRSIIGAVVGSQPFGGCGLSGTGPKAGGPNYLKSFAHEKVISINTTASGGNASLVSLEE